MLLPFLKLNHARLMAIWTLGFTLYSAQSLADVYNRQILPLGEREAFMGNSGTGGSADTGSVYYNPAALVAVPRSKVSVTGSTYLSFKTKTDSIAKVDTPSQDIPYEAKGFNTIPATYAAVFAEGEWAYAFSVLVPDSLQFDNRSTFKSTNTKGTISQSLRYGELWLGTSAAKRLDGKWSVGATLFGIQYSESSLVSLVVDLPNSANSVITSTNRYDFNVFGFSLNTGVLYEASPDVSLGLRIQSPLLPVSNHANTLVATRTVSSGTVSAVNEDQPDGKAKYQLPLDTTLGAKFNLNSAWELYSDVSLQLGAHYKNLPDSAIGSDISTDPTLRYSLGTEIHATEHIPVRLGLSYNPSALHEFKNDGGSQVKVNYLGATLGLSYLTEHVETGAGFFYIRGKGKNSTDGKAGNEADYSATGMGAMLTTAYFF